MLKKFLSAAAKACRTDKPENLSPGSLRFTFEYARKPNDSVESRKFEKLIGSPKFQFFPLPQGEAR